MIFVSTRPDLPVRITRLQRTVRFDGGRYETDDRDEIRALRRNPLVSAFTPDENARVEPAAAADHVTREALDELARQAGVEHPERLGTKADVAQAIEEAQSADRTPPQ